MKVKVECAGSAPLYHGTTLRSATRILRTGEVQLGVAEFDQQERHFNRGRMYFMSLTRDRGCAYFEDQDLITVLEFDAERLQRSYKVVPINFFYDRVAAPRSGEAEERLISERPTFDVYRYLNHVHLIVSEAAYGVRGYSSLLLLLKLHRIPYTFWRSRKAFAVRDRRNTWNPLADPEASKYLSPLPRDQHPHKIEPAVMRFIYLTVDLMSGSKLSDQDIAFYLDQTPETIHRAVTEMMTLSPADSGYRWTAVFSLPDLHDRLFKAMRKNRIGDRNDLLAFIKAERSKLSSEEYV